MTKTVLGKATATWQTFKFPELVRFFQPLSRITETVTWQYDDWNELVEDLTAGGFLLTGGYLSEKLVFFLVTLDGRPVGYASKPTENHLYNANGDYIGYRVVLDAETASRRRVNIDETCYAIIEETPEGKQARIYRRQDSLLGVVRIDRTGTWTPEFAEGVSLLPINAVLPHMGYTADDN